MSDSIPWSGRSLAKLTEIRARQEAHRLSHQSDWWIYGVPVAGALHGALLVAVSMRPGRLGIILWRWGPATLIMLTSVLLVGALMSAWRSRRTLNAARVTGFAGLIVLVGCFGLYSAYPSSYDRTPSRLGFLLPMDGPVTVAWGGASLYVNYHVLSPAERWAYDLLITRDGRSHRGDGSNLADYFAYGRSVRAPVAGRVVAVENGEPDLAPHRWKRKPGVGNHVVVQVGPREFLFIAHLRNGSIGVTRGQWIAAGQVIGLVGNSGNTSEPHIHLHLQDAPVADEGEGIPFYFSNYTSTITGHSMVRGIPHGGIRRGQFIGEIIQQASETQGERVQKFLFKGVS